jgi:hypothetical protein
MIQHAVAPPLRSGASFETRLRRSLYLHCVAPSR